MFKKILFSIVFHLLACYTICGQPVVVKEFSCATLTPTNAAALEAQNNHFTNYQQFSGVSECLNKTLSLNYLIVTDPLYNIPVTMNEVNESLQNLNRIFSPICLQFQICNIDTIYAHKYFNWNQLDEEEFKVLFLKENVINVIVVNRGTNPYASSIGISTPPLPAKDFIVVPFNHLTKAVPAHQLGHLFGLYHTHETYLGIDVVNGSSCTTAGDLVCDTPAEIELVHWTIAVRIPNYICIWPGRILDSNGDVYTPMMGNFMNIWSPCPDETFTVGQYNRMIYYLKKFRSYLR